MNDKMNEPDNTVVARITIHMPTDPVVSFETPVMFKLPKVGEILDLKYENLITDLEERELVKSTLENEVLVIDKIVGNDIYLRKANQS